MLNAEECAVIGVVVGVVPADELSAIPGVGQDLLEVRLGDPRLRYIDDEVALRVLIPFVPTICPVVDPDAGYMYMRLPRGLLDLAQPPPKKEVTIRGLLVAYGLSSFWQLSRSL